MPSFVAPACEQRGDRVGLAAVFPVRIDAGFNSELERRAVARVGSVHVSAAGNELANDLVMGAPGGNMERGGVTGDVAVCIALGP